MTDAPFRKILIANRGEIAMRIIRTAAEWASRPSRSTPTPTATRCTSAWPTRPTASARPRPRSRYLNVDKLLDAARRPGADAIHPGYGFLAENASFARRSSPPA